MLAANVLVHLYPSTRVMNFRSTHIRLRNRFQRSLLGCIAITIVAGLGCQSTTTVAEEDFEPVIARFAVEATAEISVAEVVTLPQSGVTIPVYPSIGFSELDIANVELVRVDLGLCLLFEFTPSATRTLFRVSGANIGRRLVLSLNGQPVGARLLEGPIQDGKLLIFAEMNDDELTDTAVNLKKTARKIQEAVANGKTPKL
jgi:hypothetical protein